MEHSKSETVKSKTETEESKQIRGQDAAIIPLAGDVCWRRFGCRLGKQQMVRGTANAGMCNQHSVFSRGLQGEQFAICKSIFGNRPVGCLRRRVCSSTAGTESESRFSSCILPQHSDGSYMPWISVNVFDSFV